MEMLKAEWSPDINKRPEITEKGDKALLKRCLERARALREYFIPKVTDFADMFGEKMVAEDARYEKNRRREFDQETDPERTERKQWSEVMEMVICDQADSSNWFGLNITLAKTSDFDDFRHKVDAVAEFTNEEDGEVERLALGIDITYGKEKAQEKLGEIGNWIKDDGEELAKVKYFQSEQNDHRGWLEDLPRFVISAHIDWVKEIAESWEIIQRSIKGLSGEELKKVQDKRRSAQEFLDNHPIQYQLREEILAQCEAFAIHARKFGKNWVAEKYDRVKEIIEQECPLPDTDDANERARERDEYFPSFKTYLEKL